MRFVVSGGRGEFAEAGNGQGLRAGTLVPILRAEPAATGVEPFWGKQQSRSHAERAKHFAFPGRIGVLDAIDCVFGSKCLPGPAAIELEAQLIGFGLHHFDNRSNCFRRRSGRRQIAAQRVREGRQDASLPALAFGGGADGQTQVAGMHAVMGERFGQNQARFEGRCHGEEIFVRLEYERLWYGKDFASEIGAQSQTAGSEVAAAQPEIVRIRSAIQTEAAGCIRFDHSFDAIVERFDESVAQHAERPIGRESLRDALQLSLSPPVVAIEKRDDFAAAFRNAGIESGSLAAVLLSDQADARFEAADDFRCMVGRAVVHDDDFKLLPRKILLQNTAESLFNEALVVVGVNQNAEKHVWEIFRSGPESRAEDRATAIEFAGQAVQVRSNLPWPSYLGKRDGGQRKAGGIFSAPDP